MTAVKRYVSQGHSLLHWAVEVEVLCRRCGRAGVVRGNPSWRQWHATFLCQGCGHRLETGKIPWQGPVLATGRRPCGFCGHQWVHAEQRFETVWQVQSETAQVPCPNCQKPNSVDLSFSRDNREDSANDPYFGLELALKQDTRLGTLWAFNAEHIHQLKRYTAAQLREGSGTKWSYFTRLPSWIKSAKHREQVLKALSKLEARALTRKWSPNQ
ncbi:hypothetical protein [Ferrimonas balearica]|uniref:hypothetical protein n=1 Tax=Ferrimonas balearica TaxID=44012 RepID=UPI001C996262|nr:hypothetical protein [Ferrimonas balearica]MBY5990989.1 hypothetical protein [Ferrimonas balearica]